MEHNPTAFSAAALHLAMAGTAHELERGGNRRAALVLAERTRALMIREPCTNEDRVNLLVLLINLYLDEGRLRDVAAAAHDLQAVLDDPSCAADLRNATLSFLAAAAARLRQEGDSPSFGEMTDLDIEEGQARAMSLINRSEVELMAGRRAEAYAMLIEAKGIPAARRGPEFLLAITERLGWIGADIGEAGSRAHLEEAYRLRASLNLLDVPAALPTLECLARYRLDQGDLREVRLLIDRALRITERFAGVSDEWHPRFLVLSGELALAQYDGLQAFSCFYRVLDSAIRSSRGFALKASAAAGMLDNALPTGDSRLLDPPFGVAEQLLAIDIPRGRLDIADLLRSTAAVLRLRGDSGGAERRLRAALQHARESESLGAPLVRLRVLADLGCLLLGRFEFDEALEIFDDALAEASGFPQWNVYVARVYGHIGQHLWAIGRDDLAFRLLLLAATGLLAAFHRFVYRLPFAEQVPLLRFYGESVSLLLMAGRTHERLGLTYGVVVGLKGLLTQSLTHHTRSRGDGSAAGALRQRLRDVRTRIGAHCRARSGDAAWSRGYLSLIEEKESVHAAIRDLAPPPDPPVTVQQIQDSLREGEAFIDLFSCASHEPDDPWNERLVAFILSKDGDPVFLELCTQKEASFLTTGFFQAVYGNEDPPLAEIAACIWQPLHDALPSDVTRVWLSPDQHLGNMPWPALAGAIGVTLTTSATQFVHLRSERPPDAAGDVLLAGDIDYGLREEPLYRPLPGTAVEIDTIAAHAKAAGLVAAPPLTGIAASKSALLDALPRASFVHLATHAFFRHDCEDLSAAVIEPGLMSTLGVRQSFLTRTFIAFAGANASGDVPYDAPQLLSAEELIDADLTRCRLFVVSACQGALASGPPLDGTTGLAAAALGAGARCVMVSLLPLPDASAVRLMDLFYGRLWKAGASPVAALGEAIRAFREESPQAAAREWAGWLIFGDGFTPCVSEDEQDR